MAAFAAPKQWARTPLGRASGNNDSDYTEVVRVTCYVSQSDSSSGSFALAPASELFSNFICWCLQCVNNAWPHA